MIKIISPDTYQQTTSVTQPLSDKPTAELNYSFSSTPDDYAHQNHDTSEHHAKPF